MLLSFASTTPALNLSSAGLVSRAQTRRDASPSPLET